MTAKEKYNAIIATIESLVLKQNMSNKEVIKESFAAGDTPYMTEREQRSLFVFMVGKPVDKYVTERRIMNICNIYYDMNRYDMNKACEMAQVSQKSFIDQFKRIMGDTPLEVFKKKDRSLLSPPCTWEYISEDKQELFSAVSEKEKGTQMRFGLPSIQFANAKTAENLQKYYGLCDSEADFAFDLANNNSLPFDDAFEYVYNYLWKYIELPDKYNINRAIRIKEELGNPIILHLYFDNELSLNNIRELIEYREFDRKDIGDLAEMNKEKCLKELKYYETLNNGPYDDNFTPNTANVSYTEPPEYIEGGYSDYVNTYSPDGYDVDLDNYETLQNLYNINDTDDYYIENSICETEYIYDLNDFKEYKELCQEVENESKEFKGNQERRLSECYDYLIPSAEEIEKLLSTGQMIDFITLNTVILPEEVIDDELKKYEDYGKETEWGKYLHMLRDKYPETKRLAEESGQYISYEDNQKARIEIMN